MFVDVEYNIPAAFGLRLVMTHKYDDSWNTSGSGDPPSTAHHFRHNLHCNKEVTIKILLVPLIEWTMNQVPGLQGLDLFYRKCGEWDIMNIGFSDASNIIY